MLTNGVISRIKGRHLNTISHTKTILLSSFIGLKIRRQISSFGGGMYDSEFLIFSVILPLHCYYMVYGQICIRPQLHGLKYTTNATTMRQTSYYHVEGSEQFTRKILQCAS